MSNTTVVDATTALLSERGKTHGRFKDHARVTSKLKDVFLEECRERNLRGQQPLSLEQREALDMIAHKIGRIIAGDANYHDHWDDIAGYAKLCSKKPVPLSPRFAEHQARMDERLQACPDLDQEFPECPACRVKHLPNQGCTYPVPN